MTNRLWASWLAISVMVNILFGWHALETLGEKVRIQDHDVVLETSLHDLIRVFPRTSYTRNELALAITAPGLLPNVRDCVVQSEDLVFVFNRANEILAIYPELVTNMFIPVDHINLGFKYIDPSFKCDDNTLLHSTEEHIVYQKEYDARRVNATEKIRKTLANDEAYWNTARPTSQK